MRDYQGLNDEMLLVHLKEEDERALRAIYDRYWDKLLVVAVNRVESFEAEDCLQEIFCSLWARRHDLNVTSSLESYLAASLKYKILKIYRSRDRQKAREMKCYSPVEEASIPSADAYLLERELIAKLEETVQRLPEKCQLIYRMSREQGKSRKEIADDQGITVKTVENQLTKALKFIRGEITASAPASINLAFFFEIYDLIKRH